MKFVKIVYFDESSVSDFMQIVAGGELKKTTEFISSVNAEAQSVVNANASVGTDEKGLPKLFSFLSGFKANVSVEAGADISYKKDRIVKNILENTLLVDFIDLLRSDSRRKQENQLCRSITVFDEMVVYPEPNSFSFLMLTAPFFTMIDGQVPIDSNNGDTINVDISKIEGAMEKGRGYYEFISEYKDREIILRFNSSAFRNNYTMSDLPKMALTFYAINVGKITKNKLQIEKEFEFGMKSHSRVDYSNMKNDSNIDDFKVDVYDVILAGIVEK